MAITFDLLDRFQENNAFQTAKTMNNILKVKYKMVALSPWKPRPFKLEVQKNTCLALIIQIMWLKQNFLNKSNRTLILGTCSSSIQSFLKIDLILTMLFNVYFPFPKS